MKIALSCQWNEPFADIAAITLPVMAAYAEKRGYAFFPKKHDTVSPEIVWQRLDDVEEILSDYDAVAHLDCDMLITNSDVQIEGLLMFDPNAEYFCGTDLSGPNDGFSVWRNNEGGRKLLQFVKSQRGKGHPEYTSPQHMLSHGYDFANKRVLHQRSCNSYRCAEYGISAPHAEWQPGDFILHLPGIGNDRRVQILKEHLPLIR